MREINQHERDLIEESIHVNRKGQIVIDSRIKDINDLLPMIEDNIYYSGDSQYDDSDEIDWINVWLDYEGWRKIKNAQPTSDKGR